MYSYTKQTAGVVRQDFQKSCGGGILGLFGICFWVFLVMLFLVVCLVLIVLCCFVLVLSYSQPS